jgi:hypothetical protein
MTTDREDKVKRLVKIIRENDQGVGEWNWPNVRRLCDALDPPQPDPPEPVLPYKMERVNGGQPGQWHWRIATNDKADDRVATCFLDENAKLVLNALNRPMHADADELRERAERGKVIASLQTQLDTRTKTYASTLGELENAEEALVAAGIEMGDQYGPHQSVAEGIAELADASKHWHAATQQNADLFVDNETMRLDKERLEAEVADLRKQPPDRQLMADVERFLKCASTPPAGMPSDGFVIHGNNAGRLELLARVRQASDPVPQRHNYADIAWRLGDCLLGISNVYWDSNANKYRTSPHPLSEELARTQFEKMRTVLDSMTTPNAKVGLDILHDALRDSNASDPVKPPMTTELVERLRRAIYLMGICEEQIDRDKVRALLADLEKVSDPPLSKGLRERCIDDLTAWRNSFCRKNPNCGAPETDQLIADLQAEPEDDHDYTSPPLKVVGTMKCGPVEPDKAGESKPLAQRVVELERLYEDLILQVANKHPGESRHATAKRYISEHELGPAPPKRGPVVTAAMLERWDVVLRCSPTMNELVQLRAEMRAARDKLREGGG